MKYAVLIGFAVIAGMVGGYIQGHANPSFGATQARTTITSPWTFSATTTLNGNLTVTTANAATSTVQVGCIQTTATSTLTPIRFVIGNVQAASTTFQGSNSNFTVLAQYGSCPRI